MINREKRFAIKISRELNKRGFLVEQHNSKSSRSIYLKIDRGSIPTIRISDHKRLIDDNCKYNIIRKYNGPKEEYINGRRKKYYTFKNINKVIMDIEFERNRKILSIGYIRYTNKLKNKIEYNKRRAIA